MQEYIKIHIADNVAVALEELEAGTVVKTGNEKVMLTQTVPAGHKFTIKAINKNDRIIKYGFPIGYAKEDMGPGIWIHTHNIITTLGDILDYSYRPSYTEIAPTKKACFKGYRRPDGRVGIRNEIWIIPTVGCVNSIAVSMEKQAVPFIAGSVEAVVAFPHPYGCSQLGDDQENTRQILADLVKHPNAGGILVLGLGCENSSIEELKSYIGPYDERRVKFLQCQDVEDEMEEGLALLEKLIHYAGSLKREEIEAGELIVGMKCGGSDGLSGITANPLVGSFSDRLISKGGTTILTEVPEMFGAETLLMNRCRNEEIFFKTVAMINNFKKYFADYNQPIYENPSPGNKKGGISTLEDKSLGCTQKSGSAPVSGVLDYGDIVKTKGLNLLSGPGNDLVAATALAAAGAHIILFTTGRGTPFASPVPTIKIASNTPLSQKKANWIDFNAGQLVEGTGREELTERLFQYVFEVASGRKVKAELAGYHDMAIFKKGVTL